MSKIFKTYSSLENSYVFKYKILKFRKNKNKNKIIYKD